MARQTPSSTLIALAIAAIAIAVPWTARAADGTGGLRQQPLNPIAAPSVRYPASGPGIGGSVRTDPTDSGLSGARGTQPETSGQIGALLTYRGTQYVITDGQWYEKRGRDLIAVTPPSGVLVRELPKGYAMRWIGGVPYFYADGLYYVWREGSRRYEILQSPPSEETRPAQGATHDGRRTNPSAPASSSNPPPP